MNNMAVSRRDGRKFVIMSPVSRTTWPVLFDLPLELSKEKRKISLKLDIGDDVNLLLVGLDK